MDHHTTLTRGKGQDMACENGNQAIKAVIGILSPAVAAKTSSFVVDTSLQLYPEAMRGRPDTPPATSLREYHFTILMTELASAYAEGRGQDFADDRFTIDKLLQEEPQHQPLAARFSKLMTLWLQEAHDKRQREDAERKTEEVEDDEDSEDSDDEGFIKFSKGSKGSKGSKDSPSSTTSSDGQRVSKDGDAVEGTATAARAKSVFDLSGLIDTEDDSSSDEDPSSDEEETA